MGSRFDDILDAYYRLQGHYPVKICGRRFKVAPCERRFWEKAGAGKWEPYTFILLSRCLKKHMTYCDIGAWIGPTALFAARSVRRVVCFEPDPVAFGRLYTNIRLNRLKHVTAFQAALAAEDGIAGLASFRKRLGDSMSSLLAPGHPGNRADVLTITWQRFIEYYGRDRFDFIKMDVEGSEFDLLPTLKTYLSDHRPMVYISFHPHLLSSESRKRKMTQMAEIMGMYTYCIGRDLTPVDPSCLVDGKILKKGGTFLFTDQMP